MFCTSCGAAALPGASFCTSCGYQVTSSAQATAPAGYAPPTPPGRPASPPSPPRPSAVNYCWSLLGLIGGIIGWNLIHHRDTRMARRILIWGMAWTLLGTGVSIALVARTDSSFTSFWRAHFSGAHTMATTTSTTTPTVASSGGTALTSANAVHTWTVSLSSPDSQALTASLEIGSPEAYQGGETNGSATAGTACSLTPGVDEVIPANVVMENQTPDQVSTLGADFSGVGSWSIEALPGPELLWEASYSTGTQCTGQGDGNSDVVIYSENLEPSGTSVTTNGFFEITNFSSPNYSAAQVLDDAVITVPSAFSVTPTGNSGDAIVTDFTVTGVSGPGVVQTASGWQFTLAGTPPS